MAFPKPHDPDTRRKAIDALINSEENGKPKYTEIARETGISISTLKSWWIKYQLKRHRELKTQFECAITTILKRIKNLAEETNNLKELAPVVKMLSELLQQFGDESDESGEWN